MWSKTRQILKSKLADSLKDRVDYHYDVYRTNKCRKIKAHWRWHCTEMHVLSIIVDGEAWFCTNPKFYWLKGYGPHGRTEEDVIRETGYVGCEWGYDATGFIHEYLNELSIDEAFTHDNYFIRLLAVLDSRVGKRRLRPLLDNIENEPEWFRKWILLRCEAEGLCGKTEQQTETLENQPIMNENE
ncbi:MAG: hypothetical protein IKZ99_02545 [Salinivirgaceae bacterium]|nr:hypothetical protein [Salinivirgaceae bacterium]